MLRFGHGHRIVIDALQADFQLLQRPGLQVEPLSHRGTVRDPQAAGSSFLCGSEPVAGRAMRMAVTVEPVGSAHAEFEAGALLHDDPRGSRRLLAQPPG